MDAIRIYGHFAVGPTVRQRSVRAAELLPEFHGITEGDLALVPGAALGFDAGTAADVAARLRHLYQSNLAFEFDYLENEAERRWFRRVIEQDELRRQLSPDEQRTLLRRLTEVDVLERFIHRKYVNVKRFSIEGTDALVPMLDIAIHDAATLGAREVVMGMAHRGRINVLAHILGKPFGTIFDEFDGKHADVADSETGDVKYHLGFESERAFEDGRRVRLTLVPNPSHLEVVNPVLEGLARAKQRAYGRAYGAPDGRGASVLPILVHGDPRSPGRRGRRTFNLSVLRGTRSRDAPSCNNQVARPIRMTAGPLIASISPGLRSRSSTNADDRKRALPRSAWASLSTGVPKVPHNLVGYRWWGHNGRRTFLHAADAYQASGRTRRPVASWLTGWCAKASSRKKWWRPRRTW
jgi:2-oxoglutarate dehydrogenase E1 component